jgi:hypothetical protein
MAPEGGEDTLTEEHHSWVFNTFGVHPLDYLKKKADDATARVDAAVDSVKQTAAKAEATVAETMDAAKQKVADVAHSVEAGAEEAAAKAKAVAEEAAAALAAKAAAAKQAMHDAAVRAQHAAAEAAAAAKKKLAEAENAVEKKVTETKDAVEKKVKEVVVDGKPAIDISGKPTLPKPRPSDPGGAETFELPLEAPPWKVWGGRFEIQVKATLKVTAAFLPKQGAQFVGGYNVKEGVINKVTKQWAASDLAKDFGIPDILPKTSLGFEGSMTSKKGLTVKVTTSTPLKYGTLGVNGIIVKVEPGKEWQYGALEVTYETQSIRLIDYHEADFDVVNINVVVEGNGTLQPSFVQIIAGEVIKDAAADAGATAATTATTAEVAETGEAVTEGAALLEIAIPAALAAVAIGTIAGVADMFVQRANLNALRESVGNAYRSMGSGLRDGLSGGDPKGSDELYMKFYGFGINAYRAAVAKAFQAKELPPPDEIAEAARRAADKAVHSWPGLRQAQNEIQWAFFRAWVEQNHGLGTLEPDAQLAISTIWGGPPESPSGEHMKYWASKSRLPQFFKT